MGASIPTRTRRTEFSVCFNFCGGKRMRKCFFIAALLLLSAVSAKAQQAELFGGFSYAYLSQPSASANLTGWDFSLNYKLARVIGVDGDFSGTYGSPSYGNASMHTFLFGPQFSVPSHVSPFAHVLFGVGHLNVPGATSNCFSEAIGGGLDFHVVPHVAIRAIQVDDVITHFFGNGTNNPRLSAGIVIHF
jgi:opacity protein-like surface antigen